jgi:hypothetical protein
MNPGDILREVTSRLATADALETTNTTVDASHQATRERHEAWRILGRAAWLGDGSSELRAAFEKLFPPEPALERHLNETLPTLGGTDGAAAKKAAEALESTARRDLTIPLEREVGDPRLVVPICELLFNGRVPASREPGESSAVQGLVNYLKALAARMSYGTSQEIYRTLAAVWRTAGAEVRIDAATAMCHLQTTAKWEYITKALEQSNSKHLSALIMSLNFAGTPPDDVVPLLSQAMVARYKKSKRPQDWVGALGRCAGPEAIELLEQLRATKVTSSTLEKIDRAIATLHRRFGG